MCQEIIWLDVVGADIACLLLQFRKALRRPIPREREYLERQYTGIGLQLGRHSR